MSNTYTIISGSGSYIPTEKILNSQFLDRDFYSPDGEKLSQPNEEIIEKFYEITGIKERRYVTDDLVTSDIAYYAAKDALDSSGVDPETLDYIIVAHNFGDISSENLHSEFVPALASRVKNSLKIKNPKTVAYDLPFGCPGWLQGVIQIDYFLKGKVGSRALVIGAETLSRIIDPHDRDGMIFSDGAGAIIFETIESHKPVGILSHYVETYTENLTYVLEMGNSNNPSLNSGHLYLKMQGRTLYENVLKIVPPAVKKTIEMANLSIEDINKVLVHQANDKMDQAILKRLFREYGQRNAPNDVMPMTISWLGNSSVATLPTMYDLMSKKKLNHHIVQPGNNFVFASVGAGVNVNSLIYKVPS